MQGLAANEINKQCSVVNYLLFNLLSHCASSVRLRWFACYGVWLLLTMRHIPPSSSGKLLKTARRKQINCRHCLFLAIRPASPHPNRNKGEKPKTKQGRNGRTPRNRRIPDAPTFNSHLAAPFVCPANLIRAPHGTLVLD